MKKFIRILLVAAALFVSGAAFSEPMEGRDYTLLNPPQPTSTNKIEVMEFFFYGCPHCFHLHPLLDNWEKSRPKDVEVVYVPTVFRESWEPMAYTFYALESMGMEKKLRDPLYRAWNEDKIDINDKAKVSDFVGKNGGDQAKFSAAYSSFTVQSKVTRAMQMIRSYGINGTPSLVVDGKYLITGLQPEDTVRALKDVIEMARKEHKQ